MSKARMGCRVPEGRTQLTTPPAYLSLESTRQEKPMGYNASEWAVLLMPPLPHHSVVWHNYYTQKRDSASTYHDYFGSKEHWKETRV